MARTHRHHKPHFPLRALCPLSSQSLRLLTSLTLPLAVATSAHAAGWLDDFNDGSATDGNPVTWHENPHGAFPGFYDASTGDYALSAPGNGNQNQLWSSVQTPAFSDVYIRAQGVVLPGPAGTGGGNLTLLGRLDAMFLTGYILYMDDGGILGLQGSFGDTPVDLAPPVNLGTLNAATDVMLEFNIVGNQLSGYAWRPGDPKPATPQITATDDIFTSGTAGIGFDEDDDNTTGLFRFVSAQDTPFLDPQRSLNADGNWSLAGNWTGGVPDGAGAVANFGSVITAARTVTVDSPHTVGTINFDNANRYTIAGPAALTIADSAGGAGGAMNVINGGHTISAPLTINSNTAIAVSPGNTLTLTGQMTTVAGVVLTKTGGGTLAVNNVRADGLSINDGTVAVTASGGADGTSRVNSLNIAGAGKLDLADNDLIVRDGDLDTISTFIATARNSREGRWQGNGITTSAGIQNALTGLAAVLNPGLATFSGQAVGPKDILVKYTWNGDANLDGLVNFDDYFRIDSAFLEQPQSPTFAQGDFNYDDVINFDDYFLIDSAFLGQDQPLINSAAGLPPLAGMSIPEPHPAAALLLAAAAGARRRRTAAP